MRLACARASPGHAAPGRRRCHPPSGCGGGSASTALASRPGRDIAAVRWRTTSRRGGLCTLPGSRLLIRACPCFLSSGWCAPRTSRRLQMLRTARTRWPIGSRNPVPPCALWPRQQPARPAGTNKEPRRRWPGWAPLRRLLRAGAGYEMACDGGPKGSLPRSSRSPGNLQSRPRSRGLPSKRRSPAGYGASPATSAEQAKMGQMSDRSVTVRGRGDP